MSAFSFFMNVFSKPKLQAANPLEACIQQMRASLDQINQCERALMAAMHAFNCDESDGFRQIDLSKPLFADHDQEAWIVTMSTSCCLQPLVQNPVTQAVAPMRTAVNKQQIIIDRENARLQLMVAWREFNRLLRLGKISADESGLSVAERVRIEALNMDFSQSNYYWQRLSSSVDVHYEDNGYYNALTRLYFFTEYPEGSIEYQEDLVRYHAHCVLQTRRQLVNKHGESVRQYSEFSKELDGLRRIEQECLYVSLHELKRMHESSVAEPVVKKRSRQQPKTERLNIKQQAQPKKPNSRISLSRILLFFIPWRKSSKTTSPAMSTSCTRRKNYSHI